MAELCPDRQEDPWALNVKRGLLSALQNSMDTLRGEQSVQEVRGYALHKRLFAGFSLCLCLPACLSVCLSVCPVSECVCLSCVRVCVCLCVRARACVRACMHACVRVLAVNVSVFEVSVAVSYLLFELHIFFKTKHFFRLCHFSYVQRTQLHLHFII